ncbi:hypothetical protein R3P38DRAFT_702373 [Favolaschia claudopus]|uniref:Uncharacterized protein n=1 Tax=Favolaschia claudopus TaxID=2862362 RepID=A0AAW0C9E2_9AGAR
MAVLAVKILERLLAHQSLCEHLQFFQIQQFFDITARVWPEIVPPGCPTPDKLPPLVFDFLVATLKLNPDEIQLIWTAFGDLAEEHHRQANESQTKLDDSFRLHFRRSNLGAEPLVPPVSSCVNCGRVLGKEEKSSEARLFTLHRGVLPVFSKSCLSYSLLQQLFRPRSWKPNQPAGTRILFKRHSQVPPCH